VFNSDQVASGLGQITLGQYLTSASFAVDVAENWQSEYLQFLLYILGTVWLVQRGSPESKEVGKAGQESDEDQKVGRFATEASPAWARAGGVRTALFSWSLSLVMGSIFFGSWAVQPVAGWATYNEEQLQRLQDPVRWGQYVLGSEFWSRTLQNWQSEFLAVGSMAVEHLPAAAWFTGVETGRGSAYEYRRRGVSGAGGRSALTGFVACPVPRQRLIV
jgi:hypothetical protein